MLMLVLKLGGKLENPKGKLKGNLGGHIGLLLYIGLSIPVSTLGLFLADHFLHLV